MQALVLRLKCYIEEISDAECFYIICLKSKGYGRLLSIV